MAGTHLICFDASIHDTIGIGIWDYTNKFSSYKKYPKPAENCGSNIAETMALIASLKYMKNNNIQCAFLFTDNMEVANKGISKKLLLKYNLSLDTKLFWIPRQFNREADLLSKVARKSDIIPLQTTVKIPIDSMVNNEEWHLKNEIKKYSLERRLSLGKRLANSENQMRFICELPCQLKGCSEEDKVFFRFCTKMFAKSEHNNVNKYLSALSNTPKFSSSKMENFIRSRNLV